MVRAERLKSVWLQGAQALIKNARPGFWLVLLLPLPIPGCSKDKSATAAASPSPSAQQEAAQPKAIEPVGPELRIDAARAMQYTKDIVAFGPRWDGSPAIDKVRAYIRN